MTGRHLLASRWGSDETSWKLKLIMDFSLSPEERNRHLYAIGRTRSGKTNLLKHLMYSDICSGKGIIFFDPHGPDAEDLLDCIPDERVHDVCYFNLADKKYSVGFNPPIEPQTYTTMFEDIWGDLMSDRAKDYLFHALQLLKDNPQYNLSHLKKISYHPPFRQKLLRKTTNPITIEFWGPVIDSWSKRYLEEAPQTINNKIGQFLSSDAVRQSITQETPRFDLATALRRRQIVVFNLAKGVIGENPSNLFGAMLLTHIHTILGIGEIDECNLFLDEFQNYGTRTLATMLAEDAKRGLSATLAHQLMGQLHKRPELLSAILGNVGTIACFAVGPDDTAPLSRRFASDIAEWNERNLTDQEPFHAYIKKPTGRTRSHTIPRFDPPIRGQLQKVIAESRRFARKIMA
jgi:TraM recognition site of TraD and TraG